MGVFDLTQSVVNQSAGIITGTTSIDFATVIGDVATQLEAMELGELFGLLVETMLLKITMPILSFCVMIVLVGRMIEIYSASRSAAFHPKAVRGHFGNPALASR